MSKKIKVSVQVSKTYYKSTVVEVDVPVGTEDIDGYLRKLDNKTSVLTDALADASLNADMDGIEIEDWERV